MPRNSSADILQGTLDLLVLKTLALQPMHGWGIAQRIQEMSRVQAHNGSLTQRRRGKGEGTENPLFVLSVSLCGSV